MESFAVGHFIMHELCGVQLIIMIALIKKHPLFWENIPKMFANKIMI